ncbi:ATPase [Terrihabitans soli]|uniref:histidine kinase n=1 Tax=Terrihabitans soli TaxID=708113 RepID=A0A6S6QTF5_9HYPH|nr:ActS/PrrB/RegB family redox-sensitive histidine kinase [Terrihabitans soli]BCJ92379.1 ATPase [Terrihabitans soli]
MPDTFSQMSGFSPAYLLRLDTLIRLRWLAIAGQTAAVVGVFFGLGVELPLAMCFVAILASAVLNIFLRLVYPVTERLDTRRAAMLLGFDIVQLAILLALTGGLENPFAMLFLAPVLISATSLPPLPTTLLGILAFVCVSVLAVFHMPLPWPGGVFQVPGLYVAGVWTAICLALGFIGIYAWRVADEGRQLSDALSATELVLAREQHMSALDGLAAAAAHELGTPLATIRLVARELEKTVPEGPVRDDVHLLREQVDRCREILQKLTSLHEEDAPHTEMTIRHLIEDVVAPHREFGVAIEIDAPEKDRNEPVARRNPGVLYGLGNLVENAVDFASQKVQITARWDESEIGVTIKDDGPGFPPEVLARLGDPYLTTRGAGRAPPETDRPGLGLGVFIAKTLLERSGAKVGFENGETGAVVTVLWPRSAFELAKV